MPLIVLNDSNMEAGSLSIGLEKYFSKRPGSSVEISTQTAEFTWKSRPGDCSARYCFRFNLDSGEGGEAVLTHSSESKTAGDRALAKFDKVSRKGYSIAREGYRPWQQ